ncbi:cadherin-like domain-containing protein [Polaribacter sp. Asnod6-C07]|uniref:cadherin-like domain-containing protein n=1 Tax=Polaribacter sp. Asnod6-C07 TaxID=3160582 RepID=UPI00386C4570
MLIKRFIALFSLLFCVQLLVSQTAPIASNDNTVVLKNTNLNIVAPGVLANDTDTDGDTITVTSFSINGIELTADQSASFTEGAIQIFKDGSYTFTPTLDYRGIVPTINYTITDGTFTSSANLNITIKDAPIANNDTIVAVVNTAINQITPGLLENDTDADQDVLVVTNFTINGTTYNVGQTASFSEGSILIFPDGSYNFTPTLNFSGDVPTINYTISDGNFTSSADLNISVENIPEANDDDNSTIVDLSITEATPGLLINDTDLDGDLLSISKFSVNSLDYNAGQTATFSEGSIIISANGAYSYTPTQNFVGDVPPVNYTITDGVFESSAILNLTVYLPPEPPVANNDYDTVDINTTLNVAIPGVFINDTDINVQDILTVTQFSVNGFTFNAGQTANLAQGNLTIAEDGSYIFEPTTDYIGEVPTIVYTITDGTFTRSANLYLTVEPTEDLLEISNLGSCNQGFNANGEYKIVYSLILTNINNARDLHEPALIRNIDLIDDLQSAFGVGCVVNVEAATVSNNLVENIAESSYFPMDFDNSAINNGFLNGNSSAVFNDNAINNLILYPRQSIFVSFCVTVNPFCNGRPNPTPSGSGINFTNTITANTDKGNNAISAITLNDFHTTEAVVSAGLYVPEFNNQTIDPPGLVNFDGTYDYVNTIILTNEGAVDAQNINFNMGLDDFRNRVVFTEFLISQVSGPDVTVNTNYDGNNETTLLTPNNILPAGETVVLEIYYKIGPIDNGSYSYFNQTSLSQTQGNADGFDALSDANKSAFTFVSWSDGLGSHLDRYYFANSASASITSSLYCTCTIAGMRFIFDAESETDKRITNVVKVPDGILEHEEITYQITIENTSDSVQLDELQITDNLNSTCGGNILSVSTPTIFSSSATTTPNLNSNYDGVSDTNLFDGTSGLLKIGETITVEFTVLYSESCIGSNSASFTSNDPLDRQISSSNSTSVNASTDTDNDGIIDDFDLDDDNDTIADVLEYDGLNPLDDDDADFIPNYRDTDYGSDNNADGIVDIFDFDNDGVPNHFDLDSDNDGILDIVEAGNTSDDVSKNGRTNNNVGANGLDNSNETNDGSNATINYNLPNTDGTTNPDFLDIDADGDGIVDNIEAQLTNNYVTTRGVFTDAGIDTAYPNGLTPIDSENDNIPDYIDINSDDDIRDDIIEGWDTNSDGTAETVATNSDADNDGLDDAFDNNDSLLNPTNGQTPQSFPNFDNSDTPERDWREIIAIVVLIDDVSFSEGNEFVFTLRLVTKNDNSVLIESAFPITINFSTTNGTNLTGQYDAAIAPFDYFSVLNTVFTIPPLMNTEQFSTTTLEDNIYELTEFFTLNGTITSNNTINTNFSGIGTILDNDVAPDITMNNTQEDENVDLEHTIVISHPCSTPIEIEVNTSDDFAISPDDYSSFSDVLVIAGTIDENNANTEVSFTISSFLDNLNELELEPLDVVGIVQTNNVGIQDLTKTATIVDVDPNPLVVITNEETIEGKSLNFTINLLNDSDELMQNYLPINLNFITVDSTTTGNFDYESISEQVTIPAYSSTITQTVKTLNDNLNEDTETMYLQADLFSFNVANIAAPRGVGTIKDNDYPNLFSPNGDGKSDVFEISGIEDYPNFKLTIYNRQGNKIYNYSNNGNVNPLWWDGTYNGNPAPTGVYFYQLDFNDGESEPITKFIQLIR